MSSPTDASRSEIYNILKKLGESARKNGPPMELNEALEIVEEACRKLSINIDFEDHQQPADTTRKDISSKLKIVSTGLKNQP